MAKTRAKKLDEMGKLTSELKDAKAVVFADLSTLKVGDSWTLRRKAKVESVKLTAAKKTLLKRALKEAGAELADGSIKGSVTILAATGDEVAAARVIEEFRKGFEGVTVYGGLLGSQWMDAGQIKALAALPSKQQLIAQVVGTINAPISGFVNVLAGNLRGLVNVLNAIKDNKPA